MNKTQIGKTKTFDQIAYGASVTHKVVSTSGKVVGLHTSEREATEHADVLNIGCPNSYFVASIAA
jgi:hypothetical protein